LALLIHDAVVLTSRREMTIDQFIRGPFRCALEPGEVILGVRIAHGDGVRRGFGQLLDRNSAGKAIVSVSMAVRSQAHETNLRVAVGAVADRPIVSATIRADSQASSAGYERATRHWLERVCREHSLLEDPFHSINYRCEMAVVIAGRIGRELHS
jgi:CO/xanthine dehydrogenase FAD-binding subunit